MDETKARVPKRTRYSFGFGCSGRDAAYTLVTNFIMTYLTLAVGLGNWQLAWVGVITGSYTHRDVDKRQQREQGVKVIRHLAAKVAHQPAHGQADVPGLAVAQPAGLDDRLDISGVRCRQRRHRRVFGKQV